MNIDVELDVYKALVMRLSDEQDTLNRVIERMLAGAEICPIELPTPTNQRDPGYWYRGHWYRSKNAIDVYLEFLETINEECDNFYATFARACVLRGNDRPYIAKKKEDLYPGNFGLQRYGKALEDWWIDGNISNRQKLDLMRLAAKTAGLTENIDYKISLPSAG